MFLNSIHNFRAIAILFIVCTHALHNFSWSDESLQLRILDSFFIQSSIWFVFIAGFLFQHLMPRYTTQGYYKKKLSNVLLPYALLSVPAILVSLMGFEQDVPEGFHELHPAWQATLYLVTGKHMAALWFVPMITLIYAAAPLLVHFENRRWFYWTIPGLLVLSMLLGRDGFAIAAGLNAYYTPLSRAVYLLSPYLLGMWASRHHAWLLGILGRWHLALLLMAGAALYLNVEHYEEREAFVFCHKILTSLLLLYYLNRADRWIGNRISHLAELSFGIFFIHGYLLAAGKLAHAWMFPEAALPAGGLLPLFALVILVIALCFGMLWLGKRIFGRRSRLVLGC